MSDPEYRMKKYRMKKTLQFEKIKKEEKARVLEEKSSEAKERQRKCRDKKWTKPVFAAPCKSGYSSNQSLSHAFNKVKKALQMSPRKKREVINSLSKQFIILKEEKTY